MAAATLPNLNAQVNTSHTIEFSGCTWFVKSDFWGPGPNLWSDSQESVWVDEKGRLHLKIRKINGKWHCAEVYTTEFTTFGEHRFLIEGDIQHLDKNVVLGLFVYADDNHEIDIEFSKWGDYNPLDIGSFAVQPYTIEGNIDRFPVGLDSFRTTQIIDWQDKYILFNSFQGHMLELLPQPEYFLNHWIYWGDSNPDSLDNLRTHINFWLFRGESPVTITNLEIIITKVIQPLTTEVGQNENDKKVPEDFLLYQNYPNPFRSWTTINYELLKSANVTLSIYNSLGKKVRTLVNTFQESGNYNVVWNGNDALGEKVADGIYFYSLRIDQKKTSAKKIIMLQ